MVNSKKWFDSFSRLVSQFFVLASKHFMSTGGGGGQTPYLDLEAILYEKFLPEKTKICSEFLNQFT